MKKIDLRNLQEDTLVIFPTGDKIIHMEFTNDKDLNGFYYPYTIQIKPNPLNLVPKSLEEFYKNNPELKEFWEQSKKEIEYNLASAYLSYNEADTEAFLALIQLRRLWHGWVKVLGEPNKYEKSYSIMDGSENGLWYSYSCQGLGALRFKEAEHAKKFIECFGELLDKAKILL